MVIRSVPNQDLIDLNPSGKMDVNHEWPLELILSQELSDPPLEALAFNRALPIQSNVLALFKMEQGIVWLFRSGGVVSSVTSMRVLIMVQRLQDSSINLESHVEQVFEEARHQRNHNVSRDYNYLVIV